MNPYQRIYEALINEIGDTQRGREKIKQAIHNRRVDLDIAGAVARDNPRGPSAQEPRQLAKLARGAYQKGKVKAYLKGREEGGHKGAIKAYRGAKKRQAKEVASVERKHPKAPNVYGGNKPTGAGVRSATRNMTYRNRQIKREMGESEEFPKLSQLSKLRKGMTDAQKRVWNRAMSKKSKKGEWRTPEKSKRIAKRVT